MVFYLLKQKKIPMRMCLGCRVMKPKKELVRIVKDKEKNIRIDFMGKSPGRGAYVCMDSGCLLKVKKGKGLNKAFGMDVPEEIYKELERQLEDNNG